MATRKVKDAKDLETGELIYLKGHAKVTYMSDGKTVEDAINDVASEGQAGSAAYPFLKPSEIPSALQPNTYYDLGKRSGFNINFAEGEEGVVNEYVFRLEVADGGSDLVLPDSVVWAGGKIPKMTVGKSYEISVVDNLAVFVEF